MTASRVAALRATTLGVAPAAVTSAARRESVTATTNDVASAVSQAPANALPSCLRSLSSIRLASPSVAIRARAWASVSRRSRWRAASIAGEAAFAVGAAAGAAGAAAAAGAEGGDDAGRQQDRCGEAGQGSLHPITP